MTARRPRGFTLLEVLVAIAILGLGMTAILSAQTGLFASSSYAERISLASGMVRCRLSELELKLNKEGYPLTDQKDEGNCCNDEVEDREDRDAPAADGDGAVQSDGVVGSIQHDQRARLDVGNGLERLGDGRLGSR